MNKVGDTAERITQIFNDWQNAEVRSSGVEVNTYLDEYEKAVEGARGGWNHPDNFTARKNESHVDVRLPQAWNTFIMSLEDDVSQEDKDYQAAWLLFTPLMQVSGTWRTQCYVQAKDAKDYLQRRHSRPSGIDTKNIVTERLKLWLPNSDNFADSTMTVEILERQLQIVSSLGRKSIENLCGRTEQGLDFHEEETIAARNMQIAQREWASFSTDCVILAAKMRRGNLEAVPFLEPKSISATPPPKVVYPLDPSFPGFLGSS